MSESSPPSGGEGPDPPLAPEPRQSPWDAIDDSLFLACLRCGLCNTTCPTWVETGEEQHGPRGRIELMRAVAEGEAELTREARRSLDLCLRCAACESTCPNGVKYGDLLDAFLRSMLLAGQRAKSHDRFHQRVVQRVFADPRRLRNWLVTARLAQRFGLNRLLIGTGLWRLLPDRWGRLLTLLPPERKAEPRMPHVLPPKGLRRARVALFTGCVADVLFRDVHWATARVLQENGCEVVALQSQVCCGAWHYATGDLEEAWRLARQNTLAFNANDVDAIIVDMASCGAFLRQYERMGPEEQQAERRQFAAHVRDISEFLDAIGMEPPTGEIEMTAAYLPACQLSHRQQVRQPPRNVLAQIPGLRLVELPEPELCCGAVGTYGFTEPDMSDRLGRRKLDHIQASGAGVLVSSDLHCLLHLARLARISRRRLKIVHPMVLLDLSYRREPFSA